MILKPMNKSPEAIRAARKWAVKIRPGDRVMCHDSYELTVKEVMPTYRLPTWVCFVCRAIPFFGPSVEGILSESSLSTLDDVLVTFEGADDIECSLIHCCEPLDTSLEEG